MNSYSRLIDVDSRIIQNFKTKLKWNKQILRRISLKGKAIKQIIC